MALNENYLSCAIDEFVELKSLFDIVLLSIFVSFLICKWKEITNMKESFSSCTCMSSYLTGNGMWHNRFWSVTQICSIMTVQSLVFSVYVGLNIEYDRILEIACVITDGNLTKSIEVRLPSVYSYHIIAFETHFCCSTNSPDFFSCDMAIFVNLYN